MRRGRRVWLINGVLVVALIAAGWGAYTFLWPSSDAATTTGVRTVAATRASVVESVSAAATVQSSYTGTADFSTSGTITQILVKVGDTVTKGQQLAKLDDTQARLQLSAAKSSLSAAKENLANASTTTTTTTQQGQGQSQSSQSTKSLQAQVDQAEVSVDQAQEAVNATVLTAPGDGTVTAVNGVVGQKAGSSSGGGSTGQSSSSSSSSSSSASSSGFITLTNLASLQVKASLAEIDVAKVKVGQDATVTLNALPDTPQAAKVAAIDLTATTGSNNVVTYGVTLTLNTPPAELRPGQSASAAITVAKADDAIAIPSAAMQSVGTAHTVTVLANGQESRRSIEIGVRSESLVQVTSGLNEGEQVVLAAASTTGTGGAGQRTGGTGGFGGGGFGGGGFGGAGGGGRVQQPGGTGR